MQLFSEQEIKMIEEEIQSVRKHLPLLMKINLSHAGSVVDANVLTAAGWRDQIKCEKGVEFRIDDCVRLEYAVKEDEFEYRAIVCLGASMKPSENASGWATLTKDERVHVYAGEVPRYSRMRWVSVFRIDEKRMKFEETYDNLPADFLKKIQADFETAQKEYVKPLIGDLKYQTEEFKPLREYDNLTESELLLAKLETVIADSYKHRNYASVKRLLAPLARAVITDEDQCGQILLKGIVCGKVIVPLASYAFHCHFDQMAAVLLEILIHCDVDRTNEELVEALGFLTVQLVRLGLYQSALHVVSSFVTSYCSDSARIRNAGVGILRELIRQIKTIPSDVEVCGKLLQILDAIKPVWGGDLLVRMLYSAFKVELKSRREEDVCPEMDELKEILELSCKSFNAKIKDDDAAWKKDLPPAVKSPLFWQAILYCAYGMPEEVLKAFPDPVAESGTYTKVFPTRKMVRGLSAIETWKGLLPYGDDDSLLRRKVEALALCCTQKGDPVSVRLDEFGGSNIEWNKMRIARSEHAKGEELSVVVVEGVADNGEAKTLAEFPFLPTEHPSFKENSVSAIWRYHPWSDGTVAEVELQVEDCEVRRIFALMPNYAEDKRYCARGQRFNGKICAFGHAFRKSDASKAVPETITVRKGPLVEKDGHPVELKVDPDFMDTFDQDCYCGEISHSGFILHGRFVSKRSITAYGTEILCVSVKCKRLGFVLDVYLNHELLPDDLMPNDEIEVEGWMYADLTTSVDDIGLMRGRFPDGLPLQPLYERGCGALSYVKTTWTEEEKTKRPASWINHDWLEYARKYLTGLSDVDVVEPCPHNEAAIDFLVRQNGIVRRIAFFRTESQNPLEAKLANVEVLLLTMTPSGEGVNLEWTLRNDAN